MKSIRLVSLLLAMLMLISSFASCNMLPWDKDKNVTVNVEYYIDGKLVKTETLTTEQITKAELYSPEDREGYRFIGWFTDEACEIPYTDTDLTDPENKTVKLYGKYRPIGGGTADCEHFWVMGYCRLCEAVCAHEWKNAICTICDTPCEHKGTEIGNTCKTCGKVLNANNIKIIIGAPDEQEETDYDSVKFDTAMYLDEILAYQMTYWGYKFRNDIFDITVDGVLVTDGSTLISKDCTILATPKKDVIRVNVTMIDKQGDKGEQMLYLPKEGITLEKLGLIVFPQTGGFDKLLNEVDITIDGQKITSGAYFVNTNCSMIFTVKKADPGTEKKDIGVTLERLPSGQRHEDKFDYGISLSYAVKVLAGLELYDMLMKGELYVNGEHVYEDIKLYDHTEIKFYEITDGEIIITFTGSADLGKGERVEKIKKVTKGISFEEIVYEMFGYTWDEYENKFYNTRITGNGDYTTWVPVYKDTVISNSVYIDAIGYYQHEKAEEVTLSINISGIFEGEVTVPYDTKLSEAFQAFNPPLDLETCIKEWDMFINTYALVSDAKLKYNSFIYGYKPCDEHEWKDRVCAKCGTTCYNTYYEDASCPVCGSYHPSEKPEGEMTYIKFYKFDENGQMINDGETIEIVSGESFRDVFEGRLGYDLENLMNNGMFLVNGTIITEANADEVLLYEGIKVEYYEGKSCEHNWGEDGQCRHCGEICSHNWSGNTCLICGITKPDDPNNPKMLTYTYIEDTPLHQGIQSNLQIENGSTVFDVLCALAIIDYDKLIYRNEIYVDNVLVTDGNMELTKDFTIKLYRTQKDCSHAFSKDGICGYCGYDEKNYTPPTCTHESWENSKCAKCGIWCNGSLNEGTLKHTFEGGVCTNCGCEYGGDDHYILVVWANVDPYYVLYSTTFADYCELANIQADYTSYNYYQSILPYLEYPDAERRELFPETVLGEFGNNTHIDRETINTGGGHTHEWYNSECVLCALRCEHNFGENGKCTICNCTHGGDDHYITVTTDYWANEGINAFVSEKFVPYSTTLYDLLNMTWESGYSYATKYYYFYIDDAQISSSTILGKYGSNVEISTLAIAQN